MVTGALNLTDSHVHLQSSELRPFLDEVLTRAAQSGVRYFVCNGTSERDWPDVDRLAAEHPQIVPFFGVHPWYLSPRSANWLHVLELRVKETKSGVGEIGLDRYREPVNEGEQEEVFRAQLALARKLHVPVSVHCLRAWNWLLEVLKSEPPLPCGLLIHAFGGSCEVIKPLLDLGAYLSFAGNTLSANRLRAHEAFRRVPLDRVLIETDAPDLLPPPEFRSHKLAPEAKREINSPANLGAIAAGLAALRGLPLDNFCAIIWENSKRFFGPLIAEKEKPQTA
ncbi:MAG TPA: TatD family hydrolase [Oligoflexia bacterium]|nr:TatD family hydrolase [Oligoflexia bacterium]